MKSLNRAYERRDEIIFGTSVRQYQGSIERFDHLTLAQLELLVAENFIDLDEGQNWSPTAGEFLDYMREYPAVMAHGYAVSIARDDYRVTLEGLQCPAEQVTPEMRDSFIDLCRDADDFSHWNDLYAWWG